MKKIEKLKLNEMQDFTAIEKQEGVSLKGGWAMTSDGWADFLISRGYRGGAFSLIGSMGSGAASGYYTGCVWAGETFQFGDNAAGLNAVSSGRMWETIPPNPSNGWNGNQTSYLYGSSTFNYLMSKGWVYGSF
jgi:hypothetical protein